MIVPRGELLLLRAGGLRRGAAPAANIPCYSSAVVLAYITPASQGSAKL